MSNNGINTLVSLTVNPDAILGMNKYHVDEQNAHIELIENADLEEFLKLVRACPAALYRVAESGAKSFDHAGCLECGTCRILCADTIIKKWELPQAGMGVEFRYG
ncbi:MAG: 4Fe-4S dicluster domain-containing protein [Coriobacteriia bacterium]|nr:4Fe-4S dicluster domain-containing protein [Coriobacteriia bacterium]MCL2750321.1 4Fe-4S dicluster domain-containing protein [Coriobacteriia bacterium]